MSDDARIWVGGLPEKITEEDLKNEHLEAVSHLSCEGRSSGNALFWVQNSCQARTRYEKYGRVTNILVRGMRGKTSFAFVQYNSREEAERAVKATDQAKLFGMPFVKARAPHHHQINHLPPLSMYTHVEAIK